MRSVAVWDPLVRLFHWSTAILFFANFLLLEEDGAAHRYAGYLLFALVLVRLVWGLIGTRYARFSAFWPSLPKLKEHVAGLLAGSAPDDLSHNPLGALMVFNLLATLVLISVTGIMMGSDGFWGVAWVEALHEGLSNYAMICVALHVLGVFFEIWRSKVNLIKAMVTGRKEIPDIRP